MIQHLLNLGFKLPAVIRMDQVDFSILTVDTKHLQVEITNSTVRVYRDKKYLGSIGVSKDLSDNKDTVYMTANNIAGS